MKKDKFEANKRSKKIAPALVIIIIMTRSEARYIFFGGKWEMLTCHFLLFPVNIRYCIMYFSKTGIQQSLSFNTHKKRCLRYIITHHFLKVFDARGTRHGQKKSDVVSSSYCDGDWTY